MAKTDGAASTMQFATLNMNPETVRAACATTAEQFRDFSQAWFAALNRNVESSLDLAVQLPKCTEPRDAVELCTEWLTGRQEAITTDTKTLSELWMKLCKLDTSMIMPGMMMPGMMMPGMSAATAKTGPRMSAVPSASSAAE